MQELHGHNFRRFVESWNENIQPDNSKKSDAAHELKLMSWRSALLHDVRIKAKTKFNAVVDKFMAVHATINNVHKDKETMELENRTFTDVRSSRDENLHLRYSAEKVYETLTKLGWYKRLAFDSNSDLRTVRPPVATILASTSESPFHKSTMSKEVDFENDEVDFNNDEEKNINEVKAGSPNPNPDRNPNPYYEEQIINEVKAEASNPKHYT